MRMPPRPSRRHVSVLRGAAWIAAEPTHRIMPRCRAKRVLGARPWCTRGTPADKFRFPLATGHDSHETSHSRVGVVPIGCSRKSTGEGVNRVTRPLTTLRIALVRLAQLSGLRTPVTGGWRSGRYPHALGSTTFRQRRDYFLYIPTTVTRRSRVPLLVMLHGCRQDVRSLAGGTRMNTLADEQRFIVLYPQQSLWANPWRCWNWFSSGARAGGGEAAAIVALVRHVARRYPVDRSRVYVAGMSAGGAMAATLACCHGAVFSACAIVSGLMYGAADSAVGAAQAMRTGARSSPESIAAEAARKASRRLRFVPALVMHGEDDTVVHPRNAEQIIAQFRKFAELTRPPQPLAEPVERYVTGNGRGYRQRDYARGNQVLLRSILIDELGHAWSGGDEREVFNDPTPPDASRLIWDFLSKFRRPALQRWPQIRFWFHRLRRFLCR
jgi:poly(hydroxyalkanoate) depolymerase family esterase